MRINSNNYVGISFVGKLIIGLLFGFVCLNSFSKELKIITLSPHLAELVSALGSEKQLIGVSAYSNYPKSLKNIQIIGDVHGLNLELIKSLQPDLILMWESGTPKQQKEAIHKLFKNSGTQVIESDARSLKAIPTEILRLGKLIKQEKNALVISTQFENDLNRLKQEFSNKSPLKVFYQSWSNPLMTINRHHQIGDMIALCGGRQLFENERLLIPTVSIESVVKLDPEIILSASESENSSDNPWAIWSKFPKLKVHNLNGFKTISGDWLTRPTPRALLAAKEICTFFETVRKNKLTRN